MLKSLVNCGKLKTFINALWSCHLFGYLFLSVVKVGCSYIKGTFWRALSKMGCRRWGLDFIYYFFYINITNLQNVIEHIIFRLH